MKPQFSIAIYKFVCGEVHFGERILTDSCHFLYKSEALRYKHFQDVLHKNQLRKDYDTHPEYYEGYTFDQIVAADSWFSEVIEDRTINVYRTAADARKDRYDDSSNNS